MIDMKSFSLVKHDLELIKFIKSADHKILAQWAIKCLERILPVYEEKYPNEKTPHTAIKILKQWINDEIKMWDARKYCWEVLKLARGVEIKDKVACQILRASSHCLATCHVRTHAEGSAMYVLSAMQYLNKNNIKLMEEERKWQITYLKELIRNKK